tara:strand:- start:2732 stop:3265 length:534 start_codon:yes stop_codon:yes gene_type:complete
LNIIPTNIPDVLTIIPEIHGDERGFLFESFRDSWFPDLNFVQDNHSRSVKGTLRGLHYQLNQPQGKLIRVIHGEVFDVAVDLRKSSPTFLSWAGKKLSAENKEIFWIPPGFAHGFLVLSESADVTYRCTDYYTPDDEHTILWSDKEIGIEWPLGRSEPILSERDRSGKLLYLSPHFS